MTAHFYMVNLDAEQVESVRRLRAAQDAMRPDRLRGLSDAELAAVLKEMDRARLRFALDLGDALLYAIRAGAKS